MAEPERTIIFRVSWLCDEVDKGLKTIMKNIRETCVKFGRKENGYINYADKAYFGGSVRMADAMIAQSVVLCNL